MVAVCLRGSSFNECGQLGAADEHMRFAGSGVEVNEFATVEIGEVACIGRP
jgi:hypothetical protein